MKAKKLFPFLMSLFLLFSLTACGIKIKGKQITAVGSTALQPLIEAGAEEYSSNNYGVFINVQGGGSGTGLSEIQQKAVDMGMSDLFAEEKSGIDASKLEDNKICVSGIAPIINKEVKINDISLTQLKDIFTGKITNWRSITGQNMPIVLINRSNGSGTRFNFEKIVLKGKSAKTSEEQDSSGMALSIVGSTPGAISYVSFAYLKDNVIIPSVNGIKPTISNVTTNKWKIWSYEHIYTQKDPDAEVQKFLKFLYSDKMTSLIKSMKYIPAKQMQVERDSTGAIKSITRGKTNGSN